MTAEDPIDPAAVLEGIESTEILATGQAVLISCARPSDLDRVRSFFERLGDTSTYYRFFGIRRALPESELSAVVAGQIPRHVTLLASIDGQLIGIGESIAGDSLDEAEVAFAVADDHHGEGVATLLLERLAVIGRRCGLHRLSARTLPGNVDMQRVFRTVGLDQQSRFEDGVVDIVLDLSDFGPMRAQAAERRRSAEAAGRPSPDPGPAGPVDVT